MTQSTTKPIPETKPVPLWPEEEPVLRAIAMPADTNPEGDIFGGWLVSQMDLAGATIAFRRAQGRCATIAIDGMTFLSPVFVGDEVSLFARPIHIGRTSIRVEIEAWRRRRDGLEAVKVTHGVFTFVAIDENRRPRPLPPEPESAQSGAAKTETAGAAA